MNIKAKTMEELVNALMKKWGTTDSVVRQDLINVLTDFGCTLAVKQWRQIAESRYEKLNAIADLLDGGF